MAKQTTEKNRECHTNLSMTLASMISARQVNHDVSNNQGDSSNSLKDLRVNLDPRILFKVGVNASRFTIGDSAMSDTHKTLSLDTGVDLLMPPSANTCSKTSLQVLADRYHSRGTNSLDSRYNHETQKRAVIISLRYNSDGTKLAVSLSDGRTRILTLPNWISSTDRNVKEVILEDGEVVYPYTSPATSTQWCPNKANRVVSGYAKGLIKYWDTETGKCNHTIETGKVSITCISYNHYDSKFAASANNKIFLFDEKVGKVSLVLSGGPDAGKMDGHTSKVFQVLYLPFQRGVLLSGGWDNTILIWDDRLPRAVSRIPGPHVCGLSMDVSNGNHLLAGSWRRESNIQIFDLNTLELLKEIDQHGEYKRRGIPYTQPYSAHFLGNDHIAVCGSHESLVKIFDKKDFSLRGCFADAESSLFCMDIPKTRIDLPIAVGSGSEIYFLDWNALYQSQE